MLSDRLGWETTCEEVIRRWQCTGDDSEPGWGSTPDAEPFSEENKAQGLVRATVFMAVNEKLGEQKLDFRSVKRHCHASVGRLLDIAAAYRPGTVVADRGERHCP